MSRLGAQKLQEFLTRDAAAAAASGGWKRWSLRELAAHSSSALSAVSQVLVSHELDPTTSEQLLSCAVQRLALQHQCLQEWIMKEHHLRTITTHGNAADMAAADAAAATVTMKRLDALRYVQADTYKLGRQLLENRTVWERFSDPDRHAVHATFLELRARHANTVETVVDVVTDLRRMNRRRSRLTMTNDVQQHDDATKVFQHNNNDDDDDYYERAADCFLQRRLGIQLLCDHHVELFRSRREKTSLGGVVSVEAPLHAVLTDAVSEAQHIVDVHLQTFPETTIIMHPPAATKNNNTADNAGVVTCTMVRPWVHHALVELLKNAMASAVYQMKMDETSVPPPISIHVAVTGNDDATCNNNSAAVVIDIVDRGPGIADLTSAFALGHSTSLSSAAAGGSSRRKKWDRLDDQQSYADVRSPLSSLGVGLPVSRYMVEHFGGSLTVQNNNNFDRDNNDGAAAVVTGCTARIRLPKDDTILERIPGE